MNIETKFLTQSDDLKAFVADINCAQWDAANEMCHYDVAALRNYLEQADTLFVVSYLTNESGTALAGIASARIQHKPYETMRWLYIDEVDTAANLRQRGVATAIMQHLLDFADLQDFDEVWLGTEVENGPARKLYESLKPDHIDQVIGYTFDLE